MLAKRVIPTVLVRGKMAYKGEKFNSSRLIGSALAIMQVHAKRGVDEILCLDIAATAERRGPDLDLVRELSEGCFIPLTVGGGVRSLEHIDQLLRAGADKVAICTAAYREQGLIAEASARFGAQAIVVCIEATADRCAKGLFWTDDLPITATVCAAAVAAWGAGEILLTSIDRDGMMQGYDLGLIREVSAAVDIPVIASGGCGSYADMLAAFQAGADACASGAMFAFTDNTPKGAAKFLKSRGLEVRL